MPHEARSRNYRRLTTATGTILLVAFLAGVLWHDRGRHESPPPNRPITSAQPGYVTSNSCRSCHPGNYASWHTSFHRTMTQVATASSVLADTRNLELTIRGTD